MVSQTVLDKLETGYRRLQATTASQCSSLLKKHLTREIVDKLKHCETQNGATLLDVVQSGFVHFDSSIGIYAPDAEAYTLFAELFDPILRDYHLGFSRQHQHPALDFGDPNRLMEIDPGGQYVVSTRIRCARNIAGFPFNPCLTTYQYQSIETTAATSLRKLRDDLEGTYFSLSSLPEPTQHHLTRTHLLFNNADRFLSSANALRHWPLGRGIYFNTTKTFLVWVNEEDALRIISMQKGGNLRSVYARFIAGLTQLGETLHFAHDPHLGFLTCCPSNLGTSIRASVLIKLPHLSEDMGKLKEFAKRWNLQIRGTNGEHSEAVDGVFDVSNIRRLGITEFQAVMEMQNGVVALIERERELARGSICK